jgi:ArsR family transcriptional regulator, arsenate/arsenite/antimonite-responsive transcriptional repressor
VDTTREDTQGASGPRTISLQRKLKLPDLDEELTRNSVARFKALADPTRLRILAMLAESSSSMCVCDLNEGFELEQPTISHHLKVLRKAGLVSSERKGTWVYYWLNPEAADWVRETLASLAN